MTIRRASFLAAGLAALVLAWTPWTSHWAHADLAGHMLQHLIVMNVAGLALAAGARLHAGNRLATVTVAQIILLLGWHVPPVYDAARHSFGLTVLMQISLLAVAILFWSSMLAHPVARSWQTILAALVTAKALCLFGAILCFARNPLYAGHGKIAPAGQLDDQQLAGLLMMASCAVIYVSAAIALFVRWFETLARDTAMHGNA